MMRKVTRIVLLALLLQITNASQFLISAQTPKSARSSAVTAAQFATLKQFDDFVARQMKVDKTPGLTIGFIKDGAVLVKG
jgi:CubicO group peptidase (beta-lactamase class C family)